MRRELYLEIQRVLDVPFCAWPHLDGLSKRYGCAVAQQVFRVGHRIVNTNHCRPSNCK